jgi:5-methylcytosine-specific restriction endonuclease McrA
LEKLKNLLAHQNPTGSYGNLLGIISDLALDKVDPERIEARIQKRKEKAAQTPKASEQASSEKCENSKANHAPTPPEEEAPAPKESLKPSNSRYLSPAIRRQVYLRDKGRCSFRDPVSGRVCGSSFQTQIEHVVPISLGGTSELGLLKILCRSHNLWTGIEKLGKDTMAAHIRVT